jgi:hypothetical protein
MKNHVRVSTALLCTTTALSLASCRAESARGDAAPGEESSGGAVIADGAPPWFSDVSATHLPVADLEGLSMDAGIADLDADGDLDIVIANEFGPNILLLNDGQGKFTNGSDRLPSAEHDSEDVGIADFDGDGDLDIVIVSEDDQTNELYFNDGNGRFTDEGDRLPVTGTSNGVLVADVNGDGAPDILIANNGQDALLVNDGTGQFEDEGPSRLPQIEDVTQDIELGDVDGDGDEDLVVGNEDRNRLFINDGTGHFADESESRLPVRSEPEETREADFGDVDGDGDLDILFANIQAFVPGANLRNRLLINDGTGFFTDQTEARLPADRDHSFDGDFHDLDGDGDLDIVTSNSDVDLSQRKIDPAPYRAYLNDGSGHFTEATDVVFGDKVTGTGFDTEFRDLNGDGRDDVFMASRGTADRLLLGSR